MIEEKDEIMFEDKKDFLISSNKESLLYILVSQFSWVLFSLSLVGFGFLFPKYYPAQTYYSAPAKEKWNSSKPPLVFTHISDIHVSYTEPKKIEAARFLFQTIKKYKPDLHLNTGDVIDNFERAHYPKLGYQIKEDWEAYKKVIDEEFSDQEMLDVAGNHEMFAIDTPLSKENLYLDYSNTFNRSNTRNYNEYYCKKIIKHNLTFVLINEYRFPSCHPPYGYWAHPSRAQLDRIESVIESAGPCIVLDHYTIDHNWGKKSSKGHSIEEIMQNKNINLILTGHLHTYNAMIIQHGQGGVEFVGIGAYQYKGFA